MKFVIHIGWPKTGTTTLQKHLFARGEVLYLDKHVIGGDVNNQIINQNRSEFKAKVGKICDTICRAIDSAESGKEKTIVLSDESFTNLVGVSRDEFAVLNFDDITANLQAFVSGLGKKFDVHIYMVTRGHLDFFQSYYAQLWEALNYQGVGSPREFFALIEENNLYDHRMIDKLVERFDNVVIDNFENIFLRGSVEKLAGLLGLDADVINDVLKRKRENVKRYGDKYIVTTTVLSRYNMNKWFRDRVLDKVPRPVFKAARKVLERKVVVPSFDEELIERVKVYSDRSGITF